MRMYLLDKKQRVRRWLKDDDFIEAEMTEEINAANQINFSMPLKDRIADNIYYVAIPTPHSKQKYLLFKLLSERVQNDRIEYQGIEEAYDELKQYGYIKDIRPNDRTAEEMLKMVLEPTRWTLGNVPETNHQSTNFYYITYLEALQKIVGLFNIELTFEVTIDPKSNKITRRQVNVYNQQGQRTGKRFEYGSNLLTVQQEQDSQELITALVGRGKGEQVSEGHDDTPDGYGRRITFADVVWTKKDGNPVDKPAGQEYLVDPEATELYGFSDGKPRIGLTVFEDIEDPIELINATWKALQSLKRPKVSFKASVADVGKLGLGDTVAIIRHDLKIEYFTRVYKVKHDLLNENNNQIELGDDFSSHSITNSIIRVDGIANEAKESANHAAIAANGKNNNYYSSVQPLAPIEGDIWYKDLGNGETDMYQYHNGGWVFIQSTRDLHVVENQVKEAQDGLNQAKADIINNKQKADADVENLNKSIEDNKKVADESLKKLNDSVTNLQGQYDNNIVPNLNKAMADASDALQKYITAQSSIADLTKQAQAQGKNIAEVTNTVNGLNVNFANLSGDVNSTKADVKGIQTTLGNANGDIAQLKLDAQNLQTMLAGKVDNTTYTNFVNLTNQALQAKLTASDLNGYAKTVDLQATANGLQANLNSVTGKLDNLVIGGRNLVRNSGFSKNTDYWNGVEIATHDFYYTKKQPLFLIKANTTEERLGSSTYFPLKRNTDYVVSFKGFASVNVSSYDIFILARKYGETNSYSSIKHLVDAKRLSGSSVQYVKDLVFNSGENDEAYFRIDNNGSSDGRDAWLFFTEVKVEEGNKSTAWTAAPEDERQRVDNITSQLSARITATSQQFSSYYTKAETDNRTNSAKNDAINSIKNDGNWQGLSNILTNSGFLQTADGFLQKVQQTAQPMIDANNGGGINLVKMSGFHNVTIDQLMPCWNIGNDIFINTKGGRNATGSIVIDARNISDSLREFTQWIDLEPNTDYHLSFHLLFVELAANSSFSAYTYLTEYDDQGNTTYPYRDNGRLIVNTNDRSQNSFTIHTGNTTKKGLLYVRAMKGTKIELEEIKLEKGHIGTPWSPAPSDFATQISFSELSQSLDGLRSTVGSNYGNLQSQISQSSSAVRTELNDRINGVDNKTTSTANSLNSVIGRVGSLENLTNIQIINSAINANDYTNTGNYFIQSTDNINVPGTNWCYLKVEKVNDGRIIQTWQADSDPTLRFIRTKFGDSWTDWQRAASYSEYSELNRTVQGLQSTVSSNHSDLQSQISQTAKNIRQEVSDKTGGLQTQINQQANDFNVSLNSLRNETAWQKVTSAIDANNYKTTGNYWIQATPNSNTPDSSAWAYLQVVASPDAKRIKQTWQRDNNENEIYTRLLIEDIWTSWQRTVTGGNIMAQINMSAGTTLIQNDKIYMDASSTIFSGNAFIPDAAITNISADKITAGTLDAGRINVINLNANNITAGTLRGSNGEFYLDSGALHVWQNNHDAWIDKDGIHDYDNQRSVWIQKGEINFEHQLGGSMKHTGVILTNSENSNLNGAITIKGDEGFLLSTKNFTTNYWSEQGFSWGTNTAHYVSGSGILGFNNNITVSAGSTDDHSIAALIAGAIPSKNLGNVFGARAQPGVYIYGRNDSNKDHSFVDIKAPASIHLTTLDSYITIGDTTDSERNSDVFINSGNYLTVSADNSISITACSKTKPDLMPRISLSEASTSISGDSITLNAKNHVTLLGSSVSVTGDFGVLGKKNAIVPTSRGMAAINAYETAEYYFGDIGETQTNSNGVVTVMIDPYFLETVNTLVPYQVFLTPYGNGNVWVSSRSANNFTVKSSNPNIHFAWEIKAKRKGYENDRMKIVKGVFNNEQY